MNDCERYECLVSCWHDGELERPEQVEMLDHLVRCASCRKFYVESRALDGLLAAVRMPAGAETPPRDVWDRIRSAAGAPRGHGRVLGVPAWALRTAAAIVVAVGLGVVFWSTGRLEAPEPEQAEVVIGEDAGVMTEERFLELTKEVLRADPRYRGAMQRIMEQVVRDTTVIEAAGEEPMRQPEDGEGFEREAAGQLPA
jgi:predicted anti-sigma-YlaC factor YlaD